MPSYEEEVDNETLSKASESLAKIGIQVYDTKGNFNDLDDILGELAKKWDTLSDAEQANISYNIAATRQSNKFRSILMAWTDSMDLANEAVEANGNAMENQEKRNESFSGQMQSIRTEMDAFWLSLLNSDFTHGILSFFDSMAEGLNKFAEATHPVVAGITAIAGAFLGITAVKTGMNALSGGGRARYSWK